MGSGSSTQQNEEIVVYQQEPRVKRRQITEDDDDDDEEEQDSDDDNDDDEALQNARVIEYFQGEPLKIGSNSFSALCTNTGQLLVIKKIILQKRDNYQLIKYNIQQLCNFQHKNIKQILGWSPKKQKTSKNELYVVESYEFNRSLQLLLRRYCRFSQELTFSLFKQILQGLEYLHSNNQLHKNLKTSNVLIDNEGNAILSSINILSQYKLTNYSAPECLEQLEYTKYSDIWSAGCIFYELITQQEPWAKQGLKTIDEIRKKYKQKQLFFSENDNLNKDALSILKIIFQFDPQKRPSINHLLNLKIFQEQNKLSHLVKTATKKDQKSIGNILTKVQNQQAHPKPEHKPGQIQLFPIESENAEFELKESVKAIENQVFTEFTTKQNSVYYTLTQANLYNLATKQTKFGCAVMKTKQQEKTKEVSKKNSIFNLANVLKTAKSEAESQIQSIRHEILQQEDQPEDQPDQLGNSASTLVIKNQKSETLLQNLEEEKPQIQQEVPIINIPTFQNIQEEEQQLIRVIEEDSNPEKEDVEIDGDLVFII